MVVAAVVVAALVVALLVVVAPNENNPTTEITVPRNLAVTVVVLSGKSLLCIARVRILVVLFKALGSRNSTACNCNSSAGIIIALICIAVLHA